MVLNLHKQQHQKMNINGSSTSISGFGNPTTAASANTIAYRDGSGHITGNYIFGSYLNSSDDVSTGNISSIDSASVYVATSDVACGCYLTTSS